MNVILFGATGMVGHGTLNACLSDPRVGRVLSISRRTTGRSDRKLDELIIDDFFDYSAVKERLRGYDACLFCLGVSVAGKSEAEYRRLTYDLTLGAARTLVGLNPEMTFCYVSGDGTDGSEQGRVMWARVKGETENALSGLPFKAVYHFRPAYIHPVDGARASSKLYRAFYTVLAPLYPVLRRIAPRYVTKTDILGKAMIEAAAVGAPARVLFSREINALGGA